MLEDLRFRLRALVRRGRAEDDLEDELRFHLERAVEQHVARGLSVREARRRARLAFGPSTPSRTTAGRAGESGSSTSSAATWPARYG